MRLHLVTILTVWLCLSACSQLPPITSQPPPADHDPRATCREAFPHQPWQLFHAITALFPGQHRAVFTGVTLVHPSRRALRAVLMTLEGLVLFDGEYTDRVVVHKAMGPFARPGFAQGLLTDVRMVFLPPEESSTHTGLGPDGMSVCRSALSEGGWLDLIADSETGWVLRRYDSNQRETRTATGTPEAGTPLALAPTLTLVAPGSQGYRLTLELVDAVSLAPEPMNPDSEP